MLYLVFSVATTYRYRLAAEAAPMGDLRVAAKPASAG